MKKIVPIVILCASLVAGVAYGGYRYVQGGKTDDNVKNTPGNGSEAFGAGRNNKSAPRSDGGMIAGEILAAEADNITLKLPDGGTKIVFYSNVTKVSVYEDVDGASLAVGDKVSVAGITGEDGAVAAISLQAGSSFAMDSMMNRQGKPDGVKTENADGQENNNVSKMKLSSGEITSVGNGVIVVKGGDGTETSFTTSDKTKYSKISDGSIADLVSGKIVMVAGLANTDGSVTAKSIQVRPELPEIPRQDRMKNAAPRTLPDDKEERARPNGSIRHGGGIMLPGM